jgi:hypothetical protein
MVLSPDGARRIFAATTNLGDVLFALDTDTGHETTLAKCLTVGEARFPQLHLRWLCPRVGGGCKLKLKILHKTVPGAPCKTQTDIYILIAYDTK